MKDVIEQIIVLVAFAICAVYIILFWRPEKIYKRDEKV